MNILTALAMIKRGLSAWKVAADSGQPRVPKGTPQGGQFMRAASRGEIAGTTRHDVIRGRSRLLQERNRAAQAIREIKKQLIEMERGGRLNKDRELKAKYEQLSKDLVRAVEKHRKILREHAAMG
jgi:hypothetical protein